ncbi:MAG: LysR substrate-binding domain-containing protein [Polaromonas sp.]|uniref:LysR substrate-binding domain-containing protein n=1 Tax=Polaromonas sp. TaxID=1869339 RepID=UPI002735D671|nr:LysR substrate-binding domain-containing protein [Polaromonas sp.]MDP3799022.1 LysR substrate-binding domain-containing protein [Polaromonas sp.]
MELRQLRYFVAVVDAGSITRACDSLHVVQSAVSRQLRLLEEELGSSLLLRSGLGVSPTPAGTALYSHARTILKQVEDAKSSVAFEESHIAGSVVIGIAGSTAQLCAVPILAAARASYPDVVLSIHEGVSNALVASLVAGKIDIAIVYASEATENLDTLSVVSEPLFFATTDPVARREYAGSTSVKLSELARWPLLVQSVPGATRAAIDRACAKENIRYTVAAEVNAPSSLNASVLAGLGSAVLPWVSVELIQGSENLLILPLVNPGVYREVVIVLRPGSSPSRAATLVRDLAFEKLRELHYPIIAAQDFSLAA